MYRPDIEDHPYIKEHLSVEAMEVTDLSYIGYPSHPNIGTEQMLRGFAYSDDAIGYLKKFGIDEGDLSRTSLGLHGTEEVVLPAYRQTGKYRQVFTLATALAYQENPKPDFKVSPRHLVDAIRKTPENCGAYAILNRLATKPGF